ncbi:MAG TPA: hypothetical protein VE033_03505 [Acetobacteraceae bacterium]|jgi:hypothetical protein|nr:hypothetical protein [Acetobacteraceae bacterium]
MPHRIGRLPQQAARDHLIGALAEMAGGGLAERMRVEAAARILVIARRAGQLLGTGAGGAEVAVVARLEQAWDPALITATEYADTLRPAELDALLRAAPAWAASLVATPAPQRRAA